MVLGDVGPGEGVIHAVLHAVHEGSSNVMVFSHGDSIRDYFSPARHLTVNVSWISYRAIYIVNLEKNMNCKLIFLLHLSWCERANNTELMAKSGTN